jgi:predicted nucleic-acid-binding protein
MSEAVLNELRLLRDRVDRVEELLETVVEVLMHEDVLSEDDREALREALAEHEKGETLTLEEAAKTLCSE